MNKPETNSQATKTAKGPNTFRRVLLLSLVLMMLAILMSNPISAAEPRQDLNVLYDLARDFAHEEAAELDAERIEVDVSPLDRRLKLAVCTEGLEAFKPDGTRFPGRASVGIRCHGPSHWSVYVSTNVALYKEVLVAADYLPRGTIVSRDDLSLKQVNVAKHARGYYTDPDEAIGLKLTRNLKAGKTVTPSMLRKRKLVKRGERVQLLVVAGGLMVSSQGKAKQGGARGDRIVVTNLRSKKDVEGVISEAGVVRLDL